MPFIIGGFILQLLLLVHAMKTGRDRMWIYLLLFAPGIGGAAYFIVELLPELMGNRKVRAARSRAVRAIDPDRDMREAVQQLAVSDNVGNALTVARLCIERGQHAEAADLLARKRRGVHEFDPDLLLHLAMAQFGLEQYAETIETLDLLKEHNPEFRSPEGHLIYARAKEASGDEAGAAHEYEALCGYYYGPEPTVRFADLVQRRGDAARATSLYESVLDEARVAGKTYNRRHRDWVNAAKAGLARIDGQANPAGGERSA